MTSPFSGLWCVHRLPAWAYICRLLNVHLGNKLLSQRDKKSDPIVHLRYVDDIAAIFKSHSHIRFFIERLENNSILKITYEETNSIALTALT